MDIRGLYRGSIIILIILGTFCISSCEKNLVSFCAIDIFAIDNNIYVKGNNDFKGTYLVENKKMEKILDESVELLYIDSNKILFCEDSILKIENRRTHEQTVLHEDGLRYKYYDNNVYYLDKLKNHYVHKIDINTYVDTMILTESVNNYTIYKNMIIYTLRNDINDSIFCFIDGNRKKLVEKGGQEFIYYDDKLYFTKQSDGHKIYSLYNGVENKLNDTYSVYLYICDSGIYYCDYSDGNKINKIDFTDFIQTQMINECCGKFIVKNSEMYYLTLEMSQEAINMKYPKYLKYVSLDSGESEFVKIEL